jgi:hypothetical protein
MTWRLHKIVLYSHHSRRYAMPDDGFNATGLSIVVGDSNTGKSAILEIINYCLGASDCEIADYIKRRCAWVGIQLLRDGQFVLLCRKIPAKSRKSTEIYFLKVATTDALPDNADALSGMGTGPLDSFERLLGIGALSLEDHVTPGGFAVSVRHAVPYSLLRDDVIINKSVLNSGARDEKKARHLRETLPYFLGHVTEDTIRVREELRRRRGELRTREAELAQRRSLINEGSRRLTSFVDQARSLGLIPSGVDLDGPRSSVWHSKLSPNFGFRPRPAPPNPNAICLKPRLATHGAAYGSFRNAVGCFNRQRPTRNSSGTPQPASLVGSRRSIFFRMTISIMPVQFANRIFKNRQNRQPRFALR